MLGTILRWFGYEPFRIRDLTDDMVEELTPLVMGAGETRIGKRTVIGKGFSKLDGRRFSIGDSRTAIFVASERANNSRVGVYQIHEFGSTELDSK